MVGLKTVLQRADDRDSSGNCCLKMCIRDRVNTAQSCGRKDYKEARSYAASALQMTILFGLLFSAASIIFLDPLIGFFNLTDPEAYSSARSYMLITCGLIIFSFLNLTLTGLFTAQGDSRSPLMANFLGLVGNMPVSYTHLTSSRILSSSSTRYIIIFLQLHFSSDTCKYKVHS